MTLTDFTGRINKKLKKAGLNPFDLFSWDNLTSRSRIFVPYDYYLVWHEGMRQQFLDIYRHVSPDTLA